jgi:hypothetical protein
MKPFGRLVAIGAGAMTLWQAAAVILVLRGGPDFRMHLSDPLGAMSSVPWSPRFFIESHFVEAPKNVEKPVKPAPVESAPGKASPIEAAPTPPVVTARFDTTVMTRDSSRITLTAGGRLAWTTFPGLHLGAGPNSRERPVSK